MASPKQTLHPIFLKKWMGKIEDPRKLNFFTPPATFMGTYSLRWHRQAAQTRAT